MSSRPGPAIPKFPTSRIFTPVGDNILVTVEGQVGLFTPLVGRADAPSDPTKQQSAQQVIEALRDEIARLSNENGALKEKLKALEAAARTPADFASAVQQSVDEMQTRLGKMTNPVSDFAVREFRLETSVRIDVNPNGMIDYHFVQAGEDIDPATLSKLVLDITPIPKQQVSAPSPAPGPGPSPAPLPVPGKPPVSQPLGIREIPGLEAAQVKTLENIGIRTVADFLAAGTRTRTTVELEAMLQVDREQLGRFLSQAELLMIPGIAGSMLDSLAAAGVRNAAALADFRPEDLVARLGKLNPGLRISADDAKSWIEAARALKRPAPG